MDGRIGSVDQLPFPPKILGPSEFDALLSALAARGYRVIGPTRRDGAIVYDDIVSADDLPVGWADEQAPGAYRLVRREDHAWFGHAVGPHSWKRFLHPPITRLWSATRTGKRGFGIDEDLEHPTRLAFVGVRACELAAMARQDQVLRDGPYPDSDYVARRAGLFVVAVQCATPGGTCFCASMGTGPRATEGFDIALTEIIDQGDHAFVAEAGSEAGRALLVLLRLRDASDAEQARARAIVADAERRMGRALETAGLREAVLRRVEDAYWDTVASRCLACGSCTMACPTCFCTTVEDTANLAGTHAERWRKWDSCFSESFSHMYGGSVRLTPRSRYRQWLTHKLATWWDQYGVSGCVGCGRCITWCPVGIDITVEAGALRDRDLAAASRQEPDYGNSGTVAR